MNFARNSTIKTNFNTIFAIKKKNRHADMLRHTFFVAMRKKRRGKKKRKEQLYHIRERAYVEQTVGLG